MIPPPPTKSWNQSFYNIFYYHITIESIATVKLLGLLISDNLKWNEHVTSAVNKASKLFYYIVCLKRSAIRPLTLFQIYCALVRPLLTYSLTATINMPQQLIAKLARTEKRFLKIIQNQPSMTLAEFSTKVAIKFVESVKAYEDHPFRQHLTVFEPLRTRSQRSLLAPKCRTSLKNNSILKFFLFFSAWCCFYRYFKNSVTIFLNEPRRCSAQNKFVAHNVFKKRKNALMN